MKEGSSPYKLHCFICNKGKSCCEKSAEKLFCETKEKAKALNLDVRVNQSGCLGQCEEGINAVIFKDGVAPQWISELTAEDSDKLLSKLHH